MIKNIIIFFIKSYQKILSPILGELGAECRFYPTCSQYAIEAIERFGVIKGMFLAVKRILRCNPFGGCGFDPVPEKGTVKEENKQ